MTTNEEHAAAVAQVKLATSASKLEASAEVQTDSADRRTELAADRTILAAERTYAAWVRTGLASLAAGIGARALLEHLVPEPLVITTGSVLVLFSGFCFIAGVWRQMSRFAPAADTKRLPASLLIVMNGLLLLVSVAAFIGLWIS